MKTTEVSHMTPRQINIQGRSFTIQGPTPKYGTYTLTGVRGAEYLAVPVTDNRKTYKIVGGRYFNQVLSINGNQVWISADRLNGC
jgi:hypothetical protein